MFPVRSLLSLSSDESGRGIWEKSIMEGVSNDGFSSVRLLGIFGMHPWSLCRALRSSCGGELGLLDGDLCGVLSECLVPLYDALVLAAGIFFPVACSTPRSSFGVTGSTNWLLGSVLCLVVLSLRSALIIFAWIRLLLTAPVSVLPGIVLGVWSSNERVSILVGGVSGCAIWLLRPSCTAPSWGVL